MTGAKDTVAKPKRYVSERGPFQIVANPPNVIGGTALPQAEAMLRMQGTG